MGVLAGKAYILTGGARGIGLAFCQAIIKEGGRVSVLDIQSEPDPSVEAELADGRYNYTICNIADYTSLKDGFQTALSKVGGNIDGCVTVAGIGTDKPFLEISEADLNKLVAVNQNGTFFAAQLTVQQLLSQQSPSDGIRGSIVMIASRSASGTCPGHLLSAYGGSKGFVKSFSLQLSHELAEKGIRVNSMSPGYIETDLNRAIAKSRPEVQHYFTHAPPMKRIGQTSDLTGGLIYLLSDVSSYVTGIDLAIDGGMSAGTGLNQ